jgi:hypothetical protein
MFWLFVAFVCNCCAIYFGICNCEISRNKNATSSLLHRGNGACTHWRSADKYSSKIHWHRSNNNGKTVKHKWTEKDEAIYIHTKHTKSTFWYTLYMLYWFVSIQLVFTWSFCCLHNVNNPIIQLWDNNSKPALQNETLHTYKQTIE